MGDEEEKAILAAMATDGPSSLLTCRVALKETLRDLEDAREDARLAQEATKRQAELRAAAESEVARLRAESAWWQAQQEESARGRLGAEAEIERLREEVARLREQVAEAERKLGTAKALLPVYDGRPVSQGALNALLSQRDTAREQLSEERATSARLRGLLGECRDNAAEGESGPRLCLICGKVRCGKDCRLAAALEMDR